jgi:hypothetical protein
VVRCVPDDPAGTAESSKLEERPVKVIAAGIVVTCDLRIARVVRHRRRG